MNLGEEEWQVFRQEIFPLFEKQSGKKVRGYQIESEQLITKLEALERGGRSGIDLFAQDNMNLAELMNKDLITDLSEWEAHIPEAVLPGLIKACKFDHRLVFMPFRPNVQIAYYNKEAFAKYNLELPRNWGELLSVAQTFKDREGQGRFLFKAFGGNATATLVYEFILQAGGDPYRFNDEGCVKAFDFLQMLQPFFSPESGRAKWDTTNDILARQEAYLGMNWPFGVVILIKNYGLDSIGTYHGWEGPAGEKHVIGGDVFGIPKNSRQQDLALDFIFFVQTKEIQEILTARLGWPSVRDDAYSQVAPWQRPHFEAVKEALRKGEFRKNITWWPVYSQYVNFAFQDIVMQGKDVRSTLDRYKREMEQEASAYRKN